MHWRYCILLLLSSSLYDYRLSPRPGSCSIQASQPEPLVLPSTSPRRAPCRKRRRDMPVSTLWAVVLTEILRNGSRVDGKDLVNSFAIHRLSPLLRSQPPALSMSPQQCVTKKAEKIQPAITAISATALDLTDNEERSDELEKQVQRGSTLTRKLLTSA